MASEPDVVLMVCIPIDLAQALGGLPEASDGQMGPEPFWRPFELEASKRPPRPERGFNVVQPDLRPKAFWRPPGGLQKPYQVLEASPDPWEGPDGQSALCCRTVICLKPRPNH